MRIAIVGAGRMGKWFAKFFLEQGLTVIASDKDYEKLRKIKEELSVEIADNVKAVKSADRIFVCVPIDHFEDAIKEISTHIRPGQEVMDICSVKETPVNIMHKYISNAVTLGTHPMFGPGAKSIKGQNFILTPTNVEEQALAKDFREWLESKGANVFFMTPQEHDRIMSIVLGLPYFLSYVVCDVLLSCRKFGKTKKVSGISYKLLLTLMEAVLSERIEFAENILMNLPEVDKLGELLLEKNKEWLGMIRRKNGITLINKMMLLKSKLAKMDPQYFGAYEYMYEMLNAIGKEKKNERTR
ncbi:prephenate dehydrogenase/arogenate dehydrogenase family protein [Candidatus Bathyarchaeota archaeon]|nr:prephenate dehydrogenase/arogenate dehydrogenase family protein [Candidatus Bathyarchaeota archaeon]